VKDPIRTALIIGPVLTCVGIAWTAAAPSDLSSAAVLAGFTAMVWGTHKFGRLGIDLDGLDATAETSPAVPGDEARGDK
jgi:hypothetical protein